MAIMKKLVLALATLTLALTTGCGESGKGAADVVSAATKNLDLSKLNPEQMKAEGTKLVGDVAQKLGSIKDLASVQSVTKELEPLLGNLGMLKDKLGVSGLNLSSIQTALTGLTSKFGGDMKIMDALKPLLDKVQALLK